MPHGGSHGRLYHFFFLQPADSELMQKGQLTSAILNMVLSLLLCLLAVAWGFKVAKAWYLLG